MRSSRSRERIGAFTRCLALLCCAGCARPQPRPPAPSCDPPAVLAAFQAREARVRTLRARFTAQMVRAGATRRVDGVLVMAKPDRFRFRLMLPFGVTVFDEVRDGARSWRLLPLGQPAADIDPLHLSELFLHGAEADPAQCELAALGEGSIRVLCPARALRIRCADATVVEALIGAPQAVGIRYDDLRSVAGIPLPFRIALTYPGDVSVTVAIDRYEVNPRLAEDVFVPPPDAEVVAAP